MRTGGLEGALSPRLVAIPIAALLLAIALAFMGSSSGTHDATVSMVPVNSKAGETIGYTLTVANASGDNIDNVTLEIPLDEVGNARYHVVTILAPLGWTSENENDVFGRVKKIKWWTDNVWAHIAAEASEDFNFTAITPLYDEIYTWMCRTRDINGYVDNNSVTTRVDNVPPPDPILVWPDNDENISDNTPNLDWGAVPENSLPVTYDLLVDDNPDFLSPEMDVTGIAIDNYVTAELGENTWNWKVRAVDNAGNIGPWSSPRSFRVDITPPEPPILVWPDNDENIKDNAPNLDWNPVLDPSMPVTYDLMFGWWNENWLKRRPITISGSHPENYQIKVVLPFYDNSIRFLENGNAGMLPYWIENYTADNMTVWVRRSENTDSIIYIYYENPSVGNLENFDNTFAKDYGESGLVALWHMDEGSGTTTADSSGNNNTATLTTTGLWRATDGGHWDSRPAVKFSTGSHESNAAGGYMTVSSSASMDSFENFTFEGWVHVPSLGWKTFFEKRIGDTYGFSLGLHQGSTDRFRFQLWTTPNSNLFSSPSSASTGEWHFLAATYDNSTKEMKIYVNGELEGSMTALDYFGNTALTTYLGSNDINTQNWGGAFDEFRIYDRVLNENEIRAHYERRKFADPEPTASVGGEEIATQTRITDDNYQVTTELSEGIWHWKVRAVDNVGNIGVWSPLQSFRVDITSPPAPSLLAPTDKTKICDNTPTFRWTAITAENSLPITYSLQVDNDNDLLSPEVNVTGLTENTYTQPSELPNGNYSWRARAWDNAGNAGPWSLAWTLLINSTPHDATVVLAPTNNKPGISIDYVLTVTDNATGDNIDNVTLEVPLDNNSNALYHVGGSIPAPTGWTSWPIEIDFFGYARKVRWWTDNTWAYIAAGESEDFTFTATTPDNDGTYVWACLTRDIIGYIDSDNFMTRADNVPPLAPTLLEPGNGAIVTDNTPTFRWMAVEENSLPVTYAIQVDNNNDFSSPDINVSGLTDNVYTPPAALAEDNYSWRVRATDNAGNVGPYSLTWRLLIQAPVEWNLIETWTGTIQAPAAWQVIETWTGTVEAPAEWWLIETWMGTVSAPVQWQLIETWTGTIEAPPPWTGTAVFSLVNLYTVNVEKILDLNQGSRLVVKFYAYDNAFENENIIETFSPPTHVEENENARHPSNTGVKKAALVLTYDDTEDVISTIASFVVNRSRLITRISQIKGRWPFALPPERSALMSEISGIKSQWPFAPS